MASRYNAENSSKVKNPRSTIYFFGRVWHSISTRRKFQLLGLLILIILSGFSEVVSLASVIPLLSALTNPSVLYNNVHVRSIAETFAIDQGEIILYAVLLFIIAIIGSSAIRLMNIWFSGRLAAKIGADLSCKAFSNVLYQPYRNHLTANSSKAISTITIQVGQAVTAIENILVITSSLVLSASIIIALLIVSWRASVFSIAICSCAYVVIVRISRGDLLKNSKIISDSNELQVKSVQESLGGIRDIIMSNAGNIHS